MVDVIETPSMQCAWTDLARKATADQAVDEVVRLLPVRDAGEAAVLALEEHARMQHDGHEEPRLTLGEPERLEVGGAFRHEVAKAPDVAHRITRGAPRSIADLDERPPPPRPPLAANGESDAVATESGPGRAGRVRATVVLRDDLDVFVTDLAVLILVFDPGVGEVDAAVEEREIVLACPRLDLFRLTVRPAGAVGPSPVPLLQELLVLTLQLVVEDDAPDVPAAGTEALLRALVRAINLGVVGQLARLSEAGVEGLPRLAVALQAIRLEHVSTPTRQDDDVTVPALERDSFDKARLLEMSKALPCRSRSRSRSNTSRKSSAWTTRNAPIVASASLSWPFSS